MSTYVTPREGEVLASPRVTRATSAHARVKSPKGEELPASMTAVPIPTTIAFPIRRRIPWVLAGLISLAIVGVFAGYVELTKARGGGDLGAGQFYTAALMDMDITITK